QQPGSEVPVATGSDADVIPYSWSLRDVIERGLLLYLFADEDTVDANFSALLLDVREWLTNDQIKNDGTNQRSLRNDDGQPQTFDELVKWIGLQARKSDANRRLHGHHAGTWGKLYRRLFKLVAEGSGVLRRATDL